MLQVASQLRDDLIVVKVVEPMAVSFFLRQPCDVDGVLNHCLAHVRRLNLCDAGHTGQHGFAKSFVVAAVHQQAWSVDGELGELEGLAAGFNASLRPHVQEHGAFVRPSRAEQPVVLDAEALGQRGEIERVLVVDLDELRLTNFHARSERAQEDVHSRQLIFDVIQTVEVRFLDNGELGLEVLLGPAVQLAAAK